MNFSLLNFPSLSIMLFLTCTRCFQVSFSHFHLPSKPFSSSFFNILSWIFSFYEEKYQKLHESFASEWKVSESSLWSVKRECEREKMQRMRNEKTSFGFIRINKEGNLKRKNICEDLLGRKGFREKFG